MMYKCIGVLCGVLALAGCAKPDYERYAPTVLFARGVRISDTDTLRFTLLRINSPVPTRSDSIKFLANEQNYPNPFSPTSSMRFVVPNDQDSVNLSVRYGNGAPAGLFAARLRRGSYDLELHSARNGTYVFTERIGDSTRVREFQLTETSLVPTIR